MAVLELSLGNYEDALVHAQQADEDESYLLTSLLLPDLIEAAVRSGDGKVAYEALDRYSECAVVGGTSLALGLLARSRALLADDDDAEPLYIEAIGCLERCRATSAPGACAPGLRRMAPSTEAAPGRPRTAPDRGRDVRLDRRGRIRRTDAHRARGDRRDGAVALGGDAQRSHTAGGPSRTARGRAARPTPRSVRSCSSVRARSSTTCARCSESSTSRRAAISPRHSPRRRDLNAAGYAPSSRARNSSTAASAFRCAAPMSSARAISSAKLVHRCEDHVRERVHELGRDPSLGRGLLRRALQHPQCVLLLDRARQRSQPSTAGASISTMRRTTGSPASAIHARHPARSSGRHVRGVDRRREGRFADASLDRVQHGLEQRFLAVEVVVERAPTHAHALEDGLDRRAVEAALARRAPSRR